ncbi:TonB-dependent receptor [Puia dinghuensis]|uniref:TonB-dependent receptor n=1 Tax=Puia dinghuensis TaxID=1792502 RepID=A0A8J2UD18_9BACT|nr:TonB-dependent receptor [Puia dinghuensis]GGA97956.1 TonB-dependent receptor [Puia dinghuensis]
MAFAKHLFLLLFTALTLTAFGQNTGKITGAITNATSKAPIEYATVSLLDAAGKTLRETITDKKGNFTFSSIAPGRYRVKAEFVGFGALTRDYAVPATGKGDALSIALTPVSSDLREVTVIGARPLVENHLDKIVYNAANDLTSQSGVALDVLKKVPSVSVDIDGNVELEGNSNIRFLINGKPSTIFGASVTDALQSIPASQIKSIEAIAAPGAKYDGSGTGGIINIILKDSRVQGINGAINASAGTRLENGSFNLNVRKNNFGINAFFSGNEQLNTTTLNTLDRQSFNSTKDTLTFLHQDGSTDFNRSGYQTGISAQWDITAKDKLTAGFNWNHFGNHSSGVTNQQQDVQDGSGALLSAIPSIRNAGSAVHANTGDWSLDYKKDFKKKGQDLDILVTTSVGNNFNDYYQQQNYPGGGIPNSGSKGSSPGTDKETDISADYRQPVGKDITVETGLKTVLETLTNTVTTDTLLPDGSYGPDAGQTYAFAYKRQVYAGYFSGDGTLFHHFLDVQAGMRYEYTHTQADFKGAAIPSYGTLFPSLTVSHNLDETQSIKVRYSYRIERPDYGDLNPFYNISDPHNITTGNPALRPEQGHRFELGYNKNFGGGTNLYVAALYVYNTDDIQSLGTWYDTLKIDGVSYSNVTLTQRYNIGWQRNVGSNIFGSVAITPAISLRSNMQLGFRTNSSPGLGTVSGFYFRGNLNASAKIGKDWMAELFGNYSSRQKTINGTRPVFAFYTLAIRKEFLHRKASLGFTATNPFNKYIDQKATLYGSNFTQTTIREVPYRSFGITLSYKFGKLEFKAKERENDNEPTQIE